MNGNEETIFIFGMMTKVFANLPPIEVLLAFKVQL